ncbi:uncharacterized protein A4U43_C01F12880 [Asparagus officinalis]|uniref:Uncharacterized protein n=1 Tax=Asparagus officinalis TaxID=4686 RepID=A0A5P1FNY4_ASPOF|nr:uncharacterized protein A4U43_C01F12880 [Asparagus officinalis]
MGLRLGFVNEDTPVNEVVVILNTFTNELVKIDAQYSDEDAKIPSWIRSTDIHWWTRLMKVGKSQVNTLLLQDRLVSSFESGLSQQFVEEYLIGDGEKERGYNVFLLLYVLRKIGKDHIPLNSKEEQVDYGHDDTNAYLTKPKDASDLGDIGSSDNESNFRIAGEEMPTSLPPSGGFELVTDF